MKTTKYLLISLLILSLGACEDENPPNDSQSTGDYFPTTINNEWVYDAGNATRKITSENSGKFNINFTTTTVVNGNPTTETIPLGWIEKNDGDYYFPLLYSYVEALISDGYVLQNATSVSGNLILKDYAAVGDVWSASASYSLVHPTDPVNNSAVDVETNSNFEIVARDISLNVQGTTYNNVIEVKQTDTAPGQNAVTRHFYAKDVGEIRIIYENPLDPSFNVTLDIVSYSLY